MRHYRFADRELLRYFIKLDRLKVIELQPGNKVRLLVSRRFSWRAGGPVQKYIHQKLLREFFAGHFAGPNEEFFFHGGAISEETLAQVKRVLRNASRECVEIVEGDRGVRGRLATAPPSSSRSGLGNTAVLRNSTGRARGRTGD